MWATLIVFAILPSSTLAFYSASDAVIELDQASFKDRVGANSEVWIIEFYASWCGHCKSLTPIWKETAAALEGILHVAAVDADQHKGLAGEYGIQGFPSIKLFSTDKHGKLKSKDYKGDRSAAAIVEWGLAEAKRIAMQRIGVKKGKESKGKKNAAPPSEEFYGPSSDVVVLTDSNFHEELESGIWLVEYYAPWCKHCKSLKSEWEELATNVKGKAKIGAVDCTVNKATCQEFGVQGYPTIKYFGEEKDSPSDYQGARDSASLANFILAEWRKSQPPPEAKQLVDQHVFEKECTGDDEGPAKKLCFLAFLPDILDSKAAGRNAYIKVLNGLADKYVDRPFSYLWAEGGVQAALEAALGVGGYGYPAFVALNPKDAKFANLREAFDQKNAVTFIEQLRSGFERVQAISGGIPEVASTAAWDGEEGKLEEEDEFSLDDLMSDDDSAGSKVEL